MGALELIMNIGKAWDAKKEAEQLTENMPGYVSNGIGDAARHAIAGGLISRRISPEAAQVAHWLNENILGIGQPWTERRMDDFNTQFGIDQGPKFKSDQEFLDYIQRIKETDLLKKLNRSHRDTAKGY